MNRERWRVWVHYPSWPCPRCQQGSFRLLSTSIQKITSFQERYERTAHSYNHHELLDRFTGHMQCDRPGCQETGTIAGNYLSHWLSDGTEEGLTEISYQVLSVVPAPLPFEVDQRIPKPIEHLVREAAALFWADHRAAASRVREVIEAVLTDLEIPTQDTKKGRLTLHRRIELFAKLENEKWKEQAEVIEAAKWIGNDGTHDTVTRDECLDAFEMLELVLDDIYVRTRHDLLARVRERNARHRGSKPS